MRAHYRKVLNYRKPEKRKDGIAAERENLRRVIQISIARKNIERW